MNPFIIYKSIFKYQMTRCNNVLWYHDLIMTPCFTWVVYSYYCYNINCNNYIYQIISIYMYNYIYQKYIVGIEKTDKLYN